MRERRIAGGTGGGTDPGGVFRTAGEPGWQPVTASAEKVRTVRRSEVRSRTWPAVEFRAPGPGWIL